MLASLRVVHKDSPVTKGTLVDIFPPDASMVGGFLAELFLMVIPSVDSLVATMKLVDILPPDSSGVNGLPAVWSLMFLIPEDFSVRIAKLMVKISANDAPVVGGCLVVPSLTVVCEGFPCAVTFFAVFFLTV